MALLRLEGERRNGTGLEALEGDRIPGFLAIAVRAVLDPCQRRVDLGDQLALAVPGPKLDGPVRLRGGAIRKVRMILVLALQGGEGFLSLFEDVVRSEERRV